jgi:hypothetical protein
MKKLSQQFNKKWKHLIGLFLMAMLISAGALIAPSSHPANAIFGVADITCCNLQEIAEDLLESFAESFTESIVKQEVSSSINSEISQYHMGSYLTYAMNLKNQVFVAQAIGQDGKAGSSQLDQYVIQSIITDIDTNPVAKENLNPLYAKAATDVFDIKGTSEVGVGVAAQNFMANSGSFNANSGGQYLMYMDQAEKINNKAAAAAAHDISTASGYKSSYNCTQAATALGESQTNNANSKGNNATTTANNNQQSTCLLQNPGNYVGTVLAGSIQGLFNRMTNPPNNHLSAITGAIGSAFGSIASQALVGGSSGGTLISGNTPTPSSSSGQPLALDTSVGNSSSLGLIPTTPTSSMPINPVAFPGSVQGTSTSSFGTLYAVDANGNVLAGSGTDQSQKIANKSQFTVEWNAADVTGAQYVAFAPCKSAQCSGPKDKQDLDGSIPGTMSGAVKVYTLQVWGDDQNGNMTILETDTIALKAQ